jgi:hypothetical protein
VLYTIARTPNVEFKTGEIQEKYQRHKLVHRQNFQHTLLEFNPVLYYFILHTVNNNNIIILFGVFIKQATSLEDNVAIF